MNLKIIMVFCLVISILLISGCSEEKVIEEQEKLTGQVIKENVIEKSECPSQRMMQSDLDYCVNLCLEYGKQSEGTCKNVCYAVQRVDDRLEASLGYAPTVTNLEERNSMYRCLICNECTEEQLAKKEEKKEEEENLARKMGLVNECSNKCLEEYRSIPDVVDENGVEKQPYGKFMEDCLEREGCNKVE